MRRSLLPFLVLLPILITAAWNCLGEGSEYANIPPFTRLSNVPPKEDTVMLPNPRLKLSWVGDDPDGFVVAYRYRWDFRRNRSSEPEYNPWTMILNVSFIRGGGIAGNQNLALLTDATDATVGAVYRYFATLPPPEDPLRIAFEQDSVAKLQSGDFLTVAGHRVWASNPPQVQFPVHMNPNSGEFIFESQDSINLHTFEVTAIDNHGASSIKPDAISFVNPSAPPPQTQISMGPGDTVLVIDRLTNSFGGIRFEFTTFDPNSRTIEYSWVVDRDLWPRNNVPWSPWSPQPFAVVTAGDFPDPFATKHTIYVRTRNEFGVIDTLGFYVRESFPGNNVTIIQRDTVYARRTFFTVYPHFLRPGYVQRILVLNNAYDHTPNHTVKRPSTQMLNDYYREILDSLGFQGRYDVVDVIDDRITGRRFFPGRGFLGRYSAVILVADAVDENFANGHPPGSRLNILRDYCFVGGKLIVSGWGFPFVFNSTSEFVRVILHLQNTRRDTAVGNFIGARGDKGYPDVTLDWSKIDTAAWGPGLMAQYVGLPQGFGEIVYRYDARNNSPLFEGENLALGIRYQGASYSVVYTGFPLYYVPHSSAREILRKALRDIRELQ